MAADELTDAEERILDAAEVLAEVEALADAKTEVWVWVGSDFANRRRPILTLGGWLTRVRTGDEPTPVQRSSATFALRRVGLVVADTFLLIHRDAVGRAVAEGNGWRRLEISAGGVDIWIRVPPRPSRMPRAAMDVTGRRRSSRPIARRP